MTRLSDNHVVLAVLLGALILVVSFAALNYATTTTGDQISWQETTYLVQAGDSLWTISEAYCPDGVDRREWIGEVKMLNDLDDGVIYPGQRITVLTPTIE